MEKANFLNNFFNLDLQANSLSSFESIYENIARQGFLPYQELSSENQTQSLSTSNDFQTMGGNIYYTSGDDYITSYLSGYDYYYLLEGDDFIQVSADSPNGTMETFYGWTGYDTFRYYGDTDTSKTYFQVYLENNALSSIYNGGVLDKQFADFEEYEFIGQNWQKVYVYGTDTADTVNVFSGSDSSAAVYGFSGNDILSGSSTGHDYLYGGNGNDTLYGNEGTNTFNGGKGSDTIYGGSGFDTVIVDDHWGGGVNLYFTDSFTAKIEFLDDFHGFVFNIDTAYKIDRVIGTYSSDEMHGNEMENVFLGRVGDDILYGGNGNDTLYGGNGDDKLSGDGGSDNIFGEKGSDTFIFSGIFGRDEIRDFTLSGSEEDFIDVSGKGIGSFAELQEAALFEQAEQAGLISFKDGSGVIALHYIQLDDLTADDFIFA